MNRPHYYSLEESLSLIEKEHRKKCLSFIAENRKLLKKARGSKTKHQAWIGGYIDHITETMNIAILLYDALSKARPLSFFLSDSLLVLFLHDIEKPWKQAYPDLCLEKRSGEKNDKKIKSFRSELIEKYNFKLTPDHKNALQYIEGEGENYDPHERMQKPLAAFVHLCDVWSARGWYNCPLKTNDPWKGAGRSSK